MQEVDSKGSSFDANLDGTIGLSRAKEPEPARHASASDEDHYRTQDQRTHTGLRDSYPCDMTSLSRAKEPVSARRPDTSYACAQNQRTNGPSGAGVSVQYPSPDVLFESLPGHNTYYIYTTLYECCTGVAMYKFTEDWGICGSFIILSIHAVILHSALQCFVDSNNADVLHRQCRVG